MTKSKPIGCLVLLLLAILASAVRLETISTRPLWADETITKLVVARGSFAEVIEATETEWWGAHRPLYFAVTYPHMLADASDASLRLSSVEAGVLTVLVLAGLGAMLFGRATGIVAGLLLSLCVYHIEYSQDARPYALLLLTLTSTAYCLFAYLATDRRRWLLGFVMTGTAALYCHHLAVIYQAAFSGVLAIVILQRYLRTRNEDGTGPSPWSFAWPFVGAHMLMMIFYLPTLPGSLGLINSANLAAPIDDPTHMLDLSARFFWELAGRWGNGTQWSAVYVIMLFVGMVSTMLRRDVTLALIVWLAVPFIFFAIYPFSGFFDFDIRYAMGALPPFILLVAVGIVATARVAARIAERRVRLPGPFGARVQPAVVGGLTLLLVLLSLFTYAEFRQLKFRCSDFFRNPEIMKMNDGFCPRHLILNSIYEDHAFLLRKR